MDYFEEIQRAVNYIETNLTEDIVLADIAGNINFSMYHFHRIFQAVVGESITNYLRKRRLSEAAKELIRTDKHILDISLKYCYQSQEAFSRAFKNTYSLTPGQYRGKHLPLILLEKKVLTPDRLKHLQGGINLRPEIIEKEEFHVIGMEYYGDNKNGEIPAMWAKFARRINEIPCRINANMEYGVCSPVENMTDESEFSYIAGVGVSEIGQVPAGMVAITVPTASYAVFTHKGSPARLAETYEYIMGTWFPASDYEPVMLPDFELYDQNFNPESNDSKMFIYFPVKRGDSND